MAKFITTTEISWQIEKIIDEAKTLVVIVSPYLSVHDRLEQLIEKQLSKGIYFHFVYREENLKKQTKNWFEKISSKNSGKIYLKNKPNLHAKCYLNESCALVTSMNLHDYSMVNNIEYGFLVLEKDDGENYKLIQENINELANLHLGLQIVRADADILRELGL